MNKVEKAKLSTLLNDVKTLMLVTNDQDGTYSARPMAVASIDENFHIYFFTSADGKIPYEISADKNVLLTYQDGSKFLSLIGRAAVYQNSKKAEELWKEGFKVWFPKGANDPMLVLVSFKLQNAEYWDNSGINKVKYAYEAAKAYISGGKPEIAEPDQHGRI